jgi:transposase-like protein
MHTCPHCTSKNCVQHTTRKNKSGWKRVYRCLDCKRIHTPNNGFLKMKTPSHIVIKALSLHDKGLSYKEVVDYLWEQERHKTTKSVVHYWVRKYAKLLDNFTKDISIEVEGRVHLDETYVKVKGKNKYYFEGVDQKTKMSLGDYLSHTRDTDGARTLFLQLLTQCSFLNLAHFVSDKLDGYKRAFNQLFSRTQRSKHHGIVKLDWGVPIRQKKYGIKHNNNAIERHNRYTKRKVKLLCHYKSFESAKWSLKLRRILYNFCRPHESLGGLTPAQRAGCSPDLGHNKLWILIKLLLPQRIFGSGC